MKILVKFSVPVDSAKVYSHCCRPELVLLLVPSFPDGGRVADASQWHSLVLDSQKQRAAATSLSSVLYVLLTQSKRVSLSFAATKEWPTDFIRSLSGTARSAFSFGHSDADVRAITLILWMEREEKKKANIFSVSIFPNDVQKLRHKESI